MVAYSLSAQGQDDERNETTRQANETREALEVTVEKWIAVEKLIGDEARKWKAEQAKMSELLKVHAETIKLLDEELGTAGGAAKLADEKISQLKQALLDSEKERAVVRTVLKGLTPKVLQLVKRFPEPLRDKLLEDLAQLEDAETSTRDRLQVVIRVLEGGMQFNKGFSRASQQISVGGERRQVDVLYFGLGRAFYLVGDLAGVGVPAPKGKEGWVWQTLPDSHAAIKETFAVFEKKVQPKLIKLPMQISPTETK